MEKLVIFSDMDNQRVRILLSKGSRADRLLEMSSARQSEPQWADLNLYARTYQQSATPHVHLPHGVSGFISRQSALIAWHNAFNSMCVGIVLGGFPWVFPLQVWSRGYRLHGGGGGWGGREGHMSNYIPLCAYVCGIDSHDYQTHQLFGHLFQENRNS